MGNSDLSIWRGTCFPRQYHPFDRFCLRPQGPPAAKPAMKRFIALRPAPVAALGRGFRLRLALRAALAGSVRFADATGRQASRHEKSLAGDLLESSIQPSRSAKQTAKPLVSHLPPRMSPATIESRGIAIPDTPDKSAKEPSSIISDFLVRWSLLPNGTRRAGANHRKMAPRPQRGPSAVFPDL